MKKLLVAVAFIAVLAAGGWYVASPWLAMKGVADAAQAGDVGELEERIDMVALRASAAQQISDGFRAQSGDGGLFDNVSQVAFDQIGREVIDQALTPEAIASVVASGAFAGSLLPERLRTQQVDWDVERDGIDRFRGVGTFEDGTAGPVLLFERDGLDWVMTGFALSPSRAPDGD